MSPGTPNPFDRHGPLIPHFIERARAVIGNGGVNITRENVRQWLSVARRLLVKYGGVPHDTFERPETLLAKADALNDSDDLDQKKIGQALHVYIKFEKFVRNNDMENLAKIDLAKKAGERIQILSSSFQYEEHVRRSTKVRAGASEGGKERARSHRAGVGKRNREFQHIAGEIWAQNPTLSVAQCARKVSPKHWGCHKDKYKNRTGPFSPELIRKIIKRP